MKRLSFLGLSFLLIFSLSFAGFAHPGRTDSSGGHKDNKNVSGLGYYHYHCGGNPPHLHTNGICPYSVKSEVKSTQNANSTSKQPSYKVRSDVQIIVDGKSLDVNVVEIEGRTLVPLRPILEALGANISWDSNTQTITATKDSDIVILVVGSRNALINGVSKSLDVAPVIIDGSTMIPVRFVAESFGWTVNSENNVINIFKN